MTWAGNVSCVFDTKRISAFQNVALSSATLFKDRKSMHFGEMRKELTNSRKDEKNYNNNNKNLLPSVRYTCLQ